MLPGEVVASYWVFPGCNMAPILSACASADADAFGKAFTSLITRRTGFERTYLSGRCWDIQGVGRICCLSNSKNITVFIRKICDGMSQGICSTSYTDNLWFIKAVLQELGVYEKLITMSQKEKYMYNLLRPFDLQILFESFESLDRKNFYEELMKILRHFDLSATYVDNDTSTLKVQLGSFSAYVSFGNTTKVELREGGKDYVCKYWDITKYRSAYEFLFDLFYFMGLKGVLDLRFTGAMAQEAEQVDGDRMFDNYNTDMEQESKNTEEQEMSIEDVVNRPLAQHESLLSTIEYLASSSLNTYQQKALKYKKYPREHKITYPALGLVGEAGEVAEKVKKIIRDKSGVISEDDATEIVKELGDVLWYVAILSDELGIPLAEVAKRNIAKLESRYRRNKIGGSGDNR